MKYLFQTEALGGYMLQSDPHKRHLQMEVQGEGEDRVRVNLNEIRSSDLEFDPTETLQIVNDEIVVVTRPPLVIPVPNEVTNFQLKQALNENPADRVAVDALIAGSNNQNVIDGWNHAGTFKRDNALFYGAVIVLNWTTEKVDALMKAAATYD